MFFVVVFLNYVFGARELRHVSVGAVCNQNCSKLPHCDTFWVNYGDGDGDGDGDGNGPFWPLWGAIWVKKNAANLMEAAK